MFYSLYPKTERSTMFDKFRRKGSAHQNVRRNGKRLGYIGVTANINDGKLSFNTKIRGNFESHKNGETIAEILTKGLLERENKNNSGSDFSTRSEK